MPAHLMAAAARSVGLHCGKVQSVWRRRSCRGMCTPPRSSMIRLIRHARLCVMCWALVVGRVQLLEEGTIEAVARTGSDEKVCAMLVLKGERNTRSCTRSCMWGAGRLSCVARRLVAGLESAAHGCIVTTLLLAVSGHAHADVRAQCGPCRGVCGANRCRCANEVLVVYTNAPHRP